MKQGIYRKVIVFSLIFSLLLPVTAGNSVGAASPDLDSTVPIVDEVSTEAPAFDTFEPLETESVAQAASNSQDFADAVNLNAGQTVTVNITAAYEKEYFRFTPTATGFYMLQSSNNTGDPAVWLYNASQVQIAVNDDCYMDIFEDEEDQYDNFGLTYYFIKDVTYYIAAGEHASSTGTYRLTLTPYASSIALNATYAAFGTSYTININTSYSVKFYRFTAPAQGTYIFQSTLDGGDAKIWIYNSSLSLIAQDDNSGGGSRFRAEVSMTAGTACYIMLGHNGNTTTGTYSFTPLMEITNVSGINHLENIGTGRYLDIHGPEAQELAHQWSLHTGAQQRWEFEKQTNGYYTIRSQYGNKRYLAVSNTNSGVNNVVLHQSAGTGYEQWKIYGNSSGELLIEPKSAPGKVLCVPNSAEGTELQLCWMHSAVSSRNKWQISVRWDVQLEGQKMSNWCWAASARMFADWKNGSGNNVPDGRTQIEAVTRIKGPNENKGGDSEEALSAMKYYETGYTDVADRIFNIRDRLVLNEAPLRRSLDDGHIIYISRAHYYQFADIALGHATVIGGYTSCVVGNTLTYQFIIFDPFPENENYPWTGVPETTAGHIYTASYKWLKTGDKHLTSDKKSDDKLWWGFITEDTVYQGDTVIAGSS